MPISKRLFHCSPSRMARAMGLALSVAAVSAHAQTPMPESTVDTTVFRISGFELSGDVPLSTAETTRILAPFIGPRGSLASLQQASSALEAALKASGYALHRVSLPAQELGDVVNLTIVKFVIGQVQVEGNSVFSKANIRASLPELQEDQTPNFRRLAVQTAIANENPAKQVQVSVKESEEADKIDATVEVREGNPFNGSFALANTGSDATGNDRITAVLGHSNVLDLDHQASAAFTTSAERSDAVKQLGLNYKVPFYGLGGVLAASYTYSDVVGNFGSFTSTGAGQTFGFNYSHYLPPDGGQRSFLTVALDEKQFLASKLNGAAIPGQSDRFSRPLTLGYQIRNESDTSTWSAQLEWAFNIPGGSGNTLEAYQTEDTRISKVNWNVIRANANVLMPFSNGMLLSARTQLQTSGDALIAGEQMGLGGASSVRGTADRVVAGDSGMLVSAELSSWELTSGLRALGFVDAGWLKNNNAAATTAGKSAEDQLASAGLGLRYNTGSLSMSAEWGRVITAPNVPAGGNFNLPKVGDEKLHINLMARF